MACRDRSQLDVAHEFAQQQTRSEERLRVSGPVPAADCSIAKPVPSSPSRPRACESSRRLRHQECERADPPADIHLTAVQERLLGRVKLAVRLKRVRSRARSFEMSTSESNGGRDGSSSSSKPSASSVGRLYDERCQYRTGKSSQVVLIGRRRRSDRGQGREEALTLPHMCPRRVERLARLLWPRSRSEA